MKQRPTVEQIGERVASVYAYCMSTHMSFDDLTERNRFGNVLRHDPLPDLRGIVFRIAYDAGFSYQEIAREMDFRSHASVWEGARRALPPALALIEEQVRKDLSITRKARA